MVLEPDGKVLGRRDPDSGNVVAPLPGDVLHLGTTVWPDGTVLGADGRHVGQKKPDGTVVDGRGVVLGTLEANGSIVAAFNSGGASVEKASFHGGQSGQPAPRPVRELYNEDVDTVARYPWHKGARGTEEHEWVYGTRDPALREFAHEVMHHRA